MRLLTSFSLLATACLGVNGQAAKPSDVEAYIARIGPTSLQGVLANIGPSGAKSRGAHAGVIIAAPVDDPPYAYTWTRDSSLVMKALIDRLVDGRDRSRLPLIEQWVTSQAKLQNIDSPSGLARDGSLGEPKFERNETAFTGSWGRPQRDGPALRATAVITLANYLLDRHNETYVKNTLWPIITLDLNYVAQYWNQTGFDLWEEVRAASFFTTAAQHRALMEGIALATRLKLSAATTTWKQHVPNVRCLLRTFWTGTYINSNTRAGRTGLDANSLLGSIHTFSSNAGCDSKTFQPCSDKALANHKAVVDSFRTIYGINAGASNNSAVAVGRYAEDVYYGGNPWYLATFAAAEQLYLAHSTWSSRLSFDVTSISQPFFAQFVPDIRTGKYTAASPTYWKVLSSVRDYADGFISINAKHTPADGALAEQFDRNNGSPLSAADLTWSYASALTVIDRRAGRLPNSWPATNLDIPTVCGTGPQPPKSTATFSVNTTTLPGEIVHVTGSIEELGGWSPQNSPALSGANAPVWTITLPVTASAFINYKYTKINADGAVTWESDPDRNTTAAAVGGSITLNDVWR